MNLHEMVREAISSVAPDRTVHRLPCLGQTTGPDYQALPVYGPCEAVTAQVQPVADKTLQWLVQSRQNSVWRDLYVAGLSAGLDRAEGLGGDLYYFDGAEWQVDQVLADIRARNPHIEVVVTGRYAPPALVEAADLVTDMQEIKHYYTQGVLSRNGIDR